VHPDPTVIVDPQPPTPIVDPRPPEPTVHPDPIVIVDPTPIVDPRPPQPTVHPDPIVIVDPQPPTPIVDPTAQPPPIVDPITEIVDPTASPPPVPRRGLALKAVVDVVLATALSTYGVILTQETPVKILSITPGSSASSVKTLAPGMRILSVNSFNVAKKYASSSGDALTQVIDSFVASGETSMRFETLVCPHLEKFSSLRPWWYGWSSTPSGSDLTSCANKWDSGFIPMTFGKKAAVDQPELLWPDGADALLGFNEPNHAPQANLSPLQAASIWKSVEAAAKSKGIKRIGSPSAAGFCTNAGHKCGLDTITWFDQFFCHCKDCQVDFLTTHSYACDAQKLVSFLDLLHERYGKPIWLTEFNCGDGSNQPEEKHNAFMKEVIPALEGLDYVERYSWMSVVNDKIKGSGLIDSVTGELTEIGRYYAEYPAKPAFEGASEPLQLDCPAILDGVTTSLHATPVEQCTDLCDAGRLDLMTLEKPKKCIGMGESKCRGNYALENDIAIPCLWNEGTEKCEKGGTLTCPHVKAKCAGCVKFCGLSELPGFCEQVGKTKCLEGYSKHKKTGELTSCVWSDEDRKCTADAATTAACPTLVELCESEGSIGADSGS